MSRGFFGGGGSGGNDKRPGAAKNDLTKKKSMMSVLAVSRKRKRTMNELVAERTSSKVKNYKDMVDDLIDDKMSSTGRPQYFMLPGTQQSEEKEMTKGRKMALEHFKMKRMQQRMKVRDQRVEVTPKHYMGIHGGWIDKKGKIRNEHGHIVMEVNLNTGVITNRLGLKVGKYNPASQSNDFKIQRLIDKYTKAHSTINPFANPHDTRFNPFGPKE